MKDLYYLTSILIIDYSNQDGELWKKGQTYIHTNGTGQWSKNRIIHTVSSAIMLVLKMKTCSNAIDTLGNNSSITLI